MNRDKEGNNNEAFESFEIEQDGLSGSSPYSTESSFVHPRTIRNAKYALPLILVAILAIWKVQMKNQHHPPRSEILSCTTNSGVLCDVKTIPTNSESSSSWTASNNIATGNENIASATKPTASPTIGQPIGMGSKENPSSQEPTLQPSFRVSGGTEYATSNVTELKDNNTTAASKEDVPTEKGGGQKVKYVLYFAESGWANQELCLEHAFYVARALNRTLILPPVMPHLGKGARIPRDVFGMDSGNFKTWVDPLKFYVQKLPSFKYLSITNILDRDYSFAGVQTIDAKVFSSKLKCQADSSTTTMTRWVMEYNYTHFNTKWVLSSSNLTGTVTTETRNEYGELRILNMTHRDIVAAFMDTTEDILVLLDGFKSEFDTSAMSPPFQPRMSAPIRQAARAVRNRWKVPAYAAVHIRGGDGHFRKDEKLNDTITTAMDHISLQLTKWLLLSKNYINNSEPVDTVGLYVATDVKGLFNRTAMIREVKDLVDSLHKTSGGNTTVEVLSSKDIVNETQSLGNLRYASLFMDIQMAACATIGYIGTEGSTFSQLIQDHRHGNSC
jgi:hypothetical protein